MRTEGVEPSHLYGTSTSSWRVCHSTTFALKPRQVLTKRRSLRSADALRAPCGVTAARPAPLTQGVSDPACYRLGPVGAIASPSREHRYLRAVRVMYSSSSFEVVSQGGIEPPASSVSGKRSTAELSAHVVGPGGIEPPISSV